MEPDGRCWACNHGEAARAAEAAAGVVRYPRGKCPGCLRYKSIQVSGMCFSCQTVDSELDSELDDPIPDYAGQAKDCKTCRHWTAKGCSLEAYRTCKPEVLGVHYDPAC